MFYGYKIHLIYVCISLSVLSCLFSCFYLVKNFTQIVKRPSPPLDACVCTQTPPVTDNFWNFEKSTTVFTQRKFCFDCHYHGNVIVIAWHHCGVNQSESMMEYKYFWQTVNCRVLGNWYALHNVRYWLFFAHENPMNIHTHSFRDCDT